MRWQDINNVKSPSDLSKEYGLADESAHSFVSTPGNSSLYWIDIEEENNRSYPVSTAENGMGNRLDSCKTPFGIHRIRQKLGGGQAQRNGF